MDLSKKDIIIYKIFKKLIYFSVSVFVISIYTLINHSNVYASTTTYARCNFHGSSFANAEIIIKTSNGQQLPLQNLSMPVYTNKCTNGWDNGNYPQYISRSSYQNWAISATNGSLAGQNNLTYNQIDSLNSGYGPSNIPTLYQNFGSINVGALGSAAKIYCPSNFGCDNSTTGDGYFQAKYNSTNSAVTLIFHQIIDCAYSYLNYDLKYINLPPGWTINGEPIGSGALGQIPVVNNLTKIPSIPVITLIPPPPTITVSQSCPNTSGSTGGISWTVKNNNFGLGAPTPPSYTLEGYLIDPSSGAHLYKFYRYTSSTSSVTTGSYSGFFSSVSGTNISYTAFMKETNFYPPGSVGTDPSNTSAPFNYSQCTTTPPTLTVGLNCSFTWAVSNFQPGDTIIGSIKNSKGTTVTYLPTESSNAGSNNSFLSLLEKNNQSYYASVYLYYGGSQNTSNIHEDTNSFNFFHCSKTIPTPPSISASLNCKTGLYYAVLGLSISSGNLPSGYTVYTSIDSNYYKSTLGKDTYSAFLSSLDKQNKFFSGTVKLYYKTHNLLQINTNSVNCFSNIPPGGGGGGSCGGSNLLPCPNPSVPALSGTPLTINGSLVGYGGVYSFRDLGGGDLTTPAVSILFNPNFLSVYNELFISNLGDIIQYWTEPGI